MTAQRWGIRLMPRRPLRSTLELHPVPANRETEMTKVSKATAEKSDIGAGDVYEQLEAAYEITILELREETDMAPLLRGLPDDVCPCEHWGYVVRGRVTFTFADHEEV